MKNSNKSVVNKNKSKTVTAWAVGAALSLSVANAAYAYSDNEKVINKDIALNNIVQLVLDAHVGSVKLLPSADNKVHVTVKVSEKDGWGIFNDSPQEAKLMVDNNGTRLKLSLNDDEYGEEWIIEIPQLQSISADLGVGEMVVTDLNTNLKLDIGVGEVRVYANASQFSHANAQAGVGAATVKSNVGTVEVDRAMVSEDVNWKGNGQYSMDVEVGVGDISIKLD